MKELIKAKELFETIVDLDKQIVKLESNLDKIIRDDLNGEIKFSINLKDKKKLKLDSDGSIVNEENRDANPYSFIFRMGSIDLGGGKKENTETFESKLSESELILMFATLLRHKQEQRKNYISEFNKLGLKLKI